MNRWMALGLVMVSTAAPAFGQTKGSAAEEATLRALHKQYDDAWKARDAAKAAAVYADDATAVDEQGMETKGRAAIEKGLADAMSADKEAAATGTLDTIRFIRPDIAFLHGTWNVTGGKGPSFKGYWTAVAAKQGGSWRLVTSQSALMPPPQK